MLCIIEFDDKTKDPERSFADGQPIARINGWIIATDISHARQLAYDSGQIDLGDALNRIDSLKPGKHFFSTGHMVLAS